MTSFIHQHFAQFSPVQMVLWSLYLIAAVALPLYHIPPTLRYLRGNNGIGDACIRTEVIQSSLRVPALLFSVFVVPSCRYSFRSFSTCSAASRASGRCTTQRDAGTTEVPLPIRDRMSCFPAWFRFLVQRPPSARADGCSRIPSFPLPTGLR